MMGPDSRQRESGVPIRRDRRGFSMVETLMVVVIIGLMAGIALPKFGVSSFQANGGARSLASTLSYAQRQAISQQADIRVAFDVANNRIRVHEDRDNDNVVDAGERANFTSLEEGLAFGRGVAGARPIGGAAVNFTRTQDGMPVVIFRRDGSASESGGVYISTVAGLSLGRATDVRAIEVTRATGRATWLSYGTGAWKDGK